MTVMKATTVANLRGMVDEVGAAFRRPGRAYQSYPCRELP